jgi:hypothetical protein
VTTQLWLVRPFLRERFVLGVGAGPYIAVDNHPEALTPSENPDRVAGLVTLTGSYRLSPDWFTRLSWNRIVTEYSRDSDVVLLGVGYRF